MPRFARIAITLPKADLAAADRLARAQDRPRSWLIAEAVRQYVAGTQTARAEAADDASDPRFTPGLGESRLSQLRRDMTLTPEERVRAAEETLLLTERTRRPKTQHVIAFERYQDYIDWQRVRDRMR